MSLKNYSGPRTWEQVQTPRGKQCKTAQQALHIQAQRAEASKAERETINARLLELNTEWPNSFRLL